MKATALWSLAALGFCSVLALEKIIATIIFDVTLFPGKWYPVITANYHDPFSEKPNFAFTARVLPKRALEINFEIPSKDGTCMVKTVVLNRVRIGVFRTKDKQNIVRVVDTDRRDHTIWYFKMGDTILLQLLARSKTVSTRWEYRFLSIANSLEFDPDNVTYLRKSDLCTETPAQA